MTRILVVDDDRVSCQLMSDVLQRDGTTVLTETDPHAALEIAEQTALDLVLIDVRMPGMNGISLLTVLHDRKPDLPVIIMTGFASVDTAVEAVGAGAVDYLSKPADVEAIRSAVARALGPRGERRADLPASEETVDDLVGRSPSMVGIYNAIARVAPGRSTVLVLGESGTGKELVARAIHRHSARRAAPFLAVDCGALSDSLLESELFGHVRGAFTGAVAEAPGVFVQANEGTIFLDEIGDVSPALQSRLLRVLQEQQVRPVGSTKWRKVDVRIIAATNKDLVAEVAAGRFREDLLYRLRVVTVEVPTLRERIEDLPLLVDHLVRRAARDAGRAPPGLSQGALRALESYSWPGNVRELSHALERAVVLCRKDMLTERDLPAQVVAAPPAMPPAVPDSERPTLAALKRRYVQTVLSENGGNITRTARVLGIDRRSLHRMLERYAGRLTDPEREKN